MHAVLKAIIITASPRCTYSKCRKTQVVEARACTTVQHWAV